MASSSRPEVKFSASRASKPTFRRAGGRSGASAKPQRNTVAHSKSVGMLGRPVIRSSARSSVIVRPQKVPLASLGDVKACYGRQACPSHGNSQALDVESKAARPGRTLGASKPRSLTSVPATAKKPSSKKVSTRYLHLERWQIKHQTPLLSLQAKAKSWAAFWPSCRARRRCHRGDQLWIVYCH